MSPTTPACSLLFCPPSPKGKDSPLPALAERSSQREGGIYSFLMQGAPPLASPRLSRKRHWLGEQWRYPARGSRLGRRIALPPLHPAEWGKQSGDPEDPPRGDRRQAAGRSSRAEYSEVPGIVGPLSGSDGSFFVILPDRRSSFCGEKRPPG